MKTTTARQATKDESLKTFAVKLPIKTHHSLAAKAQQHGVGMQELGVQLVDCFLHDKLKLKVNVAVDTDLAAELAELATALSEPKPS